MGNKLNKERRQKAHVKTYSSTVLIDLMGTDIDQCF
jgi:hypothetical protein